MIQNAILVAYGREKWESFLAGEWERNKKGPTMLSHWGKAAYYGPHSGLSQEAAASHILVGAAEMFLFGNASSAKLEPERKGEKRQHPEHFKFISYIFTQLNQAQREKKKKESHVSTSFPRASPNTAGCLNSLLFVIIIIQLALVKIVIDQALVRQHYRVYLI